MVGLIADVFFQTVEDTKVTPPQPTPPPEKVNPPVAHKEASDDDVKQEQRAGWV